MRKPRAVQEIRSGLYRPMSELEVGGEIWIDCDNWRDTMRRVSNVCRYPRQMRDRKFSSQLFVAIEARNVNAMPRKLVLIYRES